MRARSGPLRDLTDESGNVKKTVINLTDGLRGNASGGHVVIGHGIRDIEVSLQILQVETGHKLREGRPALNITTGPKALDSIFNSPVPVCRLLIFIRRLTYRFHKMPYVLVLPVRMEQGAAEGMNIVVARTL